MKIKKNILYVIGILLIVLIGSFVIFGSGIPSSTGNVVLNGEAQTAKLYVENGQYILEPSEFKKDVPIRLEADISKMPGCSRSIRIPEFEISKIVSDQDKIIEFMPNKAGTFNIACSMNMYRGQFTVLESDGTKPNYVEKSLPAGNSCGSSGGCGCG